MSVNGVEIEVGQKWRTRAGDLATVVSNDCNEMWPWNVSIEGRGTLASVDTEGFIEEPANPKPDDLVELLYPVQAELPDLADPPEKFAASIPVGVEVHPSVERNPTTEPKYESALDVQVGGDHYKTFAIQPVEFIHRNGIPFIEGSAIKYLCRWRDKGGIQDLQKVKHYIDLLIEMETPK